MKKAKIRHIALFVSDLERSIKFYNELFGFEVLDRNKEIHNIALESFKDYLFEASEDLEWVKLKTGNDVVLELIYCNRPLIVNELNHVAFTVTNLNDIIKKINPMIEAQTNGKIKLLFFRDYDGNLIELVEDLES
jgi:catechol 2,3-dioxygenase-like lactoylglutathione lyase family enzyme